MSKKGIFQNIIEILKVNTFIICLLLKHFGDIENSH